MDKLNIIILLMIVMICLMSVDLVYGQIDTTGFSKDSINKCVKANYEYIIVLWFEIYDMGIFNECAKMANLAIENNYTIATDFKENLGYAELSKYIILEKRN